MNSWCGHARVRTAVVDARAPVVDAGEPVRNALVTAVMRLGLTRDLRKTCQVSRRAMPCSTGARAWVSARLTVRWVQVSSPWGGRLRPVATGARAGAIGQDGNALAFAGPDDPVGASRCQVEAPAGQGRRDPYYLADRVGHTNGSVR